MTPLFRLVQHGIRNASRATALDHSPPTTPCLEQEFRYDIQWHTHNSGVTTDNFGVRTGLEIIPAKNGEVILAIPPYIVNNPDSPACGKRSSSLPRYGRITRYTERSLPFLAGLRRY
jgi:hypothetical protein